MLTVEAIRGYGGLPEEVAKKADEFCMYLNNYIYGNFFALYNIMNKYVWKKSLILNIKKQAESKTVPQFDYLFVFLI